MMPPAANNYQATTSPRLESLSPNRYSSNPSPYGDGYHHPAEKMMSDDREKSRLDRVNKLDNSSRRRLNGVKPVSSSRSAGPTPLNYSNPADISGNPYILNSGSADGSSADGIDVSARSTHRRPRRIEPLTSSFDGEAGEGEGGSQQPSTRMTPKMRKAQSVERTGASAYSGDPTRSRSLAREQYEQEQQQQQQQQLPQPRPRSRSRQHRGERGDNPQAHLRSQRRSRSRDALLDQLPQHKNQQQQQQRHSQQQHGREQLDREERAERRQRAKSRDPPSELLNSSYRSHGSQESRGSRGGLIGVGEGEPGEHGNRNERRDKGDKIDRSDRDGRERRGERDDKRERGQGIDTSNRSARSKSRSHRRPDKSRSVSVRDSKGRRGTSLSKSNSSTASNGFDSTYDSEMDGNINDGSSSNLSGMEDFPPGVPFSLADLQTAGPGDVMGMFKPKSRRAAYDPAALHSGANNCVNVHNDNPLNSNSNDAGTNSFSDTSDGGSRNSNFSRSNAQRGDGRMRRNRNFSRSHTQAVDSGSHNKEGSAMNKMTRSRSRDAITDMFDTNEARSKELSSSRDVLVRMGSTSRSSSRDAIANSARRYEVHNNADIEYQTRDTAENNLPGQGGGRSLRRVHTNSSDPLAKNFNTRRSSNESAMTNSSEITSASGATIMTGIATHPLPKTAKSTSAAMNQKFSKYMRDPFKRKGSSGTVATGDGATVHSIDSVQSRNFNESEAAVAIDTFREDPAGLSGGVGPTINEVSDSASHDSFSVESNSEGEDAAAALPPYSRPSFQQQQPQQQQQGDLNAPDFSTRHTWHNLHNDNKDRVTPALVMRKSSVGSGLPGRNYGAYNNTNGNPTFNPVGVGTYTVPTFKGDGDDDDDASRCSRSSRRSNGSGRGCRIKINTFRRSASGDSHVSGGGNVGVARSGPASAMKRGSNLPPQNFDDDDSEDDWMEEALLNGITEANKSGSSTVGIKSSQGGSSESPPRRVMRPSEGMVRRTTVAQGAGPKLSLTRLVNRSSSMGHGPQRDNDLKLHMAAGKLPFTDPNDLTWEDSDDGADGIEDDDEGGRATITLPLPPSSNSKKRFSEERIRRTIGDLTDPKAALEYLMGETDHQHLHQQRHSFLSNIPTLPTVKTFVGSKTRFDEPAGLFLTKARNGSVTVHSVAPESLFSNTGLQSGQEVLSVNGKRVNDPKLAATLVMQAKRDLSLRVSTCKRPRGFQYCQVKRKDNGGHGHVGGQAGGGAGALHHGVRFVTTTPAETSSTRRSSLNNQALTEGLVRVSHIDANGLFANSHPLNRLRVGCIVLTVNGEPITNGRTALEKVMESSHLVEVLHCDERIWREDWVKDGLEQVLSGERKDPRGVTEAMFVGGDAVARDGKEETLTTDVVLSHLGDKIIKCVHWEMEWKCEREEVTFRHHDLGYAFKLKFSEDNCGTCHSESVDGETMPPTDEVDVSLLVETVNDMQRIMMRTLQSMVQKAKFELKFGPGSSRGKLFPMEGCKHEHLSRTRDPNDPLMERGRMARHRTRSCEALSSMLHDDGLDDQEELAQLADSLMRSDVRDRTKRRSNESDDRPLVRPIDMEEASRRGSVGAIPSHFNELSLEDLLAEDNHNRDTNDKVRDYATRRKRAEERHMERHHDSTGKIGRRYSQNTNATSFASSAFSADMLEEYLDDLDDIMTEDGSHMSSSSRSLEGHSYEPPQSPRNDSNRFDNRVLISPNGHEKKSENHVEELDEEKQGEDEAAYITGVLRYVESKYEIKDNIMGAGGFGEVRECTDKKTGQLYVVKTILKPDKSDNTKINLIRNEILLLHEAHHPNIVELKDLFEDDKYVHIVMERCTGGDLFDRVVNENPRRLRSRTEGMKHENRTANAMRSILNVLKYLHSKDIVHRDIKPEHFMLSTEERETQKIKLIDFGLARKHKKGTTPMTTFTGSPSFVAPEVIARSYDHMCDMFSVGVTAYFLLTGLLPFDAPSDEETFDLISEGKFSFPSSNMVFLSDDAKDFISKLLTPNPKERMSAERALNHPWLRKSASC